MGTRLDKYTGIEFGSGEGKGDWRMYVDGDDLLIQGKQSDGGSWVTIGRINNNGLMGGNNKVMFTPEGGIAVRLINKTSAASVKGTVVEADANVDEAFNIAETDDYQVSGVVYESGVADGSACWVVIAGIAEVLVTDTTAVNRGVLMLCSSTQAGRVTPATQIPPTTDAEHFREVGHTLTSCTSGTNKTVKMVLHWN